MIFTDLTINDVIQGKGSDEVGEFLIQGTLDGQNIKFVKQYIGKHRIFYRGNYQGNIIRGTWGFSQFDQDQQDAFEIRRKN